MDTLLIYGANGYTGRLVADAALAAGLQPILAGRSGDALAEMSSQLALPHRVMGLDDSDALRRGLDGVHTVLHCAGPFSRTARPMVEACIDTHTHYLDITGEIAVFELLARKYDQSAKAAGVMLLPGVGFDVVPSDCMARYLADARPDAETLTLAFSGQGGVSHGTATTAIENIAEGGAIRVDGRIERVPAAFHTREFDFGQGMRPAVTIPWGDVSTAFHSTGIPNIRVYMAAPTAVRQMMVISRYMGWLLSHQWVQSLLQGRIDARASGPDAETRASGYAVVIGEARSPDGQTSSARLTCPEAYALTATAAVHIAKKTLEGHAPPGFQTPSRAYGADLILEIPGVTRRDLD